MKKIGTLRSQAGFSLVELMVVVAIIGVLAAMSAGQVQKQIAKARQSEAKTNLSTLYSAMEAFKAEWSTYYGDFGAIKFNLAGQVRYDVGFSGVGGPAGGPSGWAAAGGVGNNFFRASQICAANGAAPVAPQTCSIVLSNGVQPTAPTTAVNGTGTAFTAMASALVYGGGGNVTQDQWTITEAKLLRNSQNGIP